MKNIGIKPIYLYTLMLGQAAISASWADPNSVKANPNAKGFMAVSYTEPNAASGPFAKPVAGTLAMNWLHQGQKPPQPLVGQSDVTFHIERYPWPYTGYFYDQGYFAGPWFYDPWYRHRYGYWRYYSNDYWRHHSNYHDGWWYNDAYTYPLNYVEVQMKLNENTSLNFGVSFIYDYLDWP